MWYTGHAHLDCPGSKRCKEAKHNEWECDELDLHQVEQLESVLGSRIFIQLYFLQWHPRLS